MKASIRALILASPAVHALARDRVYARRVPQGAQYPAITFELDRDVGIEHGGASGLDEIRLSVDCWARDASNQPAASTVAGRLADAVVDALAGKRMQHGAFEFTFGAASTAEDGLDPETGLYSVAVELSGWARRA